MLWFGAQPNLPATEGHIQTQPHMCLQWLRVPAWAKDPHIWGLNHSAKVSDLFVVKCPCRSASSQLWKNKQFPQTKIQSTAHSQVILPFVSLFFLLLSSVGPSWCQFPRAPRTNPSYSFQRCWWESEVFQTAFKTLYAWAAFHKRLW